MEANFENKNQPKGYQLPSIDLLNDYEPAGVTVTEEELCARKDRIVEVLNDYEIQVQKISATVGPTITFFEITPAKGTRISKIKSLGGGIMFSLGDLGVRVIAPIPGRGTLGIEVPNEKPKTVTLRSVLATKKFKESKYELPIAIGQNIDNSSFIFDLTKAPHLLMAGGTDQEKSMALNTILASLLYAKTPEQLKLVLIDQRRLRLAPYKILYNSFLAQVPKINDAIISDTQDIISTLQSLCIEMDTRYDLLKNSLCRNIKEYNEKFIERRITPENGSRYMPYIVVVIDEFADLIMTAGKKVELPIGRLAQLARAVGIHLIIATKRPTTNIITGLIRANFPARIAFKTGLLESRTILDALGAERLLGRGDMLISMGVELTRVQCASVDESEIERIVDYVSNQHFQPKYSMGYEEGEFTKREVELFKQFISKFRNVSYSIERSTSDTYTCVATVDQYTMTICVDFSDDYSIDVSGAIGFVIDAIEYELPFREYSYKYYNVSDEKGLKILVATYIDYLSSHLGTIQRVYLWNDSSYILPEYVPEKKPEKVENETDLSKLDSLFKEAARIVVKNQQGSTALLQRAFSMGYNRVSRIMDQLEAAGIVGPYLGTQARKVLIPDELALDEVLEKLP